MSGDKLHLNNPMRRSYLIQRLSRPTGVSNPFSFGGGLADGGLSEEAMGILTGIFSFDYMGSSEFEWGAVPAALQFIAEQADKKGAGIVAGEHKGVLYICPKPYKAGVKVVIDNLLADEISLRLKEYCGLKDVMNPKPGGCRHNTVGWLELNNGFFMFTDKDMFDRTKRLFAVK